MKKSIIAVGVVAVLGAGWVGASWYTGKMIESRIDGKLSQFSDVIKNNLDFAELKISYTDYQRGLFSTTLHLVVEEVGNDVYAYSKNDSKIIVEDDITIYHGPFPWSEIKSFNLMPKLAAFNYEMTEESNEQLWEITNQKPYLTMKTVVDYSENINIIAKTIPVVYQDEELDTNYNLSAATFDFSTDKHFAQAELQFLMDQFYIQNNGETFSLSDVKVLLSPQSTKNVYDLNLSFDEFNSADTDIYNPHNITVKKFAYQSTLDTSKEIGFTYNDKLNIDNIIYHMNDIPIVLKQLNILNQTDSVDNKSIAGVFSYALDGITIGKQELGSSKATVSFENLPFKLVLNSYVSDHIDDQTDVDYIKLNLESLSWTNSKGVMDMSLLMEASGLGLTSADMNEENLDEVKFTANIPFEALSYLVAQISNPEQEGVEESDTEETQKGIKMLTAMLLNSSSAFNVIEEDSADKKAGIYSDISYSKNNDEAYINGKKMTVEDFFDELK